MGTRQNKRKSSAVQASPKKGARDDRGTPFGRDAARNPKKRFPSGRSLEYAVIFERSSTGYGAYVPDLPGCVATAKTLEKVRRLIQEAVQSHLDGMREDGEPIPKPTSIANAVRVAV